MDGEIIAAYSLPLLITAYVSFYLVVLWDWYELDTALLYHPMMLAAIGYGGVTDSEYET